MDLEVISPSRDSVKCCDCGCSCSLISSSSGTWYRSIKRKYDEFEDGKRFRIPELDADSNPRVQIENECALLRETVSTQQQTIHDLYIELEEERNASSSAANEAMSMILRLQREKAEIHMEARQFKRFAEEKMSHDQQELMALEDLLYKREQVLQSLTCEVQAYKHRMLSYGLTEADAEGEKRWISRQLSMVEDLDAQFDLPTYNYPPLKCNLNENPGPLEVDNDVADVEKYAFGETPRHLKNLEHRIHQMERSPRHYQPDGDFSNGKNILEKVIVGHSPRLSRHSRRFSSDSSGSYMGMVKETGSDYAESPRFKGSYMGMVKETGSDYAESARFNSTIKKMEQTDDYSNLRKMDNASDVGDDMSDRVYTIDSVQNGVQYKSVTDPKPSVGICEDFVTTPRESLNQHDVSDPDIKKLYMRLQALEADRESMRQAIISMRTDKAQMVLLKEIAQHLSKEMTPERRMPVRKPSIIRTFSFMSIFKWITSFVFWRRKACRSKYSYGLTANNVGLLMLLDKGPRMRQWRCLASTQV